MRFIVITIIAALAIWWWQHSQSSINNDTVATEAQTPDANRPAAGAHKLTQHAKTNSALKPKSVDHKTQDQERFEIWHNDPEYLPEQPITAYLAELNAAIEAGDGDAAFHLFQASRRCFGSPPTRQDLDQVAVNIQYDETLSSVEQQTNIQTLYELYDYCEGFEKINLRSPKARDLIIQAARAGNLYAQLEFATYAAPRPKPGEALDLAMIRQSEAITEYKRESMHYLHNVASAGVPGALGRLGSAYWDGILTERDPRQAYAYLYAADLVNSNEKLPQVLNDIASTLDQESLNQAAAQGERIASQCCP
jgi:TPR repeat protein